MKKADFLNYYSKLSNIELLKIIQEKEKYRADAIEAAKEILGTRTYSKDEHANAINEVNLVVIRKAGQKEKVKKLKRQINSFIEEHFGTNERSPQQKLNILCAVIFIYTLISAITNFTTLAMIFYYQDLKGYVIAGLLYSLEFLFIYLLYKRSNWGWVFFVFSTSLLVLLGLTTLLLSSYPDSEFVSIFVNIGILIFLNSKGITNQFTMTKDGRQTTFIIVGLIAGLIIFFGYFL